MEGFSAKIAQIESTMSLYGREVVIAFAVIVLGLILIKWINQGLKRAFKKLPISPAKGATIRNVIIVLMSAALIAFVAIELGLRPRPVVRFLAILTLASIGIVMVFRPLIPTLPFKVGNTVKVGDLLGKVEATTVLNTRLKTFDGKTVFITAIDRLFHFKDHLFTAKSDPFDQKGRYTLFGSKQALCLVIGDDHGAQHLIHFCQIDPVDSLIDFVKGRLEILSVDIGTERK